VMPAYNEADGIADFLEEIHSRFTAENITVAYHIQNDASTDATIGAVDCVRRCLGLNMSVETNENNLGHGPTSVRALSFGARSGADLVLHVDGDGQFSADDILHVVLVCMENGKVVVGQRVVRSDPWYRRWITMGLRLWVCVLARNLGVKDPNSPLRVQTRQDLQRFLAVVPSNSKIPSVWWSVYHIRWGGIKYVPVTSRDRRGSSSVGTMWGKRRATQILPPRRLVLFSLAAFRESFKILRMRRE